MTTTLVKSSTAAALLLLLSSARAEPPADPIPATPPTPSYQYPPPVYQQQLVFSPTESEAELQVRQRDVNGKLVWRPVCAGACTTAVFPGAEYRVSGDGVSSSRIIKIEPSPYPAYLRADVGSSSARTTGLVIMPIGGVAMVLGMVGLALSSCNNCDPATASDRQRRAIQFGIPLLVGGAAVVAAGIVLIVGNRTKVEFRPPGYGSSPRIDLGRGFALGPQGLMF